VQPAIDALAQFLGGFVAAEGTFGSGGIQPRFRFAVGLGAIDASICELFHQFLDVGHVYWSPRRKSHYDDEVTFAVQAMADLIEVVVPFMDEHLPVSYKRQQYLAWRAELLDYWEHHARRRRPCAVDECEQPQRAHGFCRRHLWEFRRQ
jgi:hypothetical protein